METVFNAKVIAAFGRHVLVRDASGQELKARPFGRRLSVVCGDEVRCEVDERHGETHVVEVQPRRSALYRSNLRGESEAVVANLSMLLVVLAPRPEPDLFVIDRYLSAAASVSIAATIVVNKVDLGINEALRAELQAWEQAGYRILECAARSGIGMDEFIEVCSRSTSVLVGQSGVGKSSFVKKLVPDAAAETGELMRDEEGRHTTTASRLFDLPRGGYLIDSPGVRDFAPALEKLEPSTLGFMEVAQLAPSCRFLDCRHLREPACAVRKAAESGSLHARRYESYRRLRRLYEELSEARGPGKKPR
jgi:ribosome biogenesis GTPase / thiamine phosphate phosphatase